MALTDTPDPFPRETDAVIVHFSQPVRQIFSMLVVVGLVAAGGYLIFPALKPVLLSNPFLNGLIVAVFLIGVLACFWQVLQLIGCVNWIETFASGESTGGRLPPRLLVSLAALLRGRGRSMEISATSSRSILDSVATRIEELRDITRYLVNLLIFLGLLGTFYGLATTVPAVVETIRSLAPQDGEAGGAVFGRLLTGLEAQLGGMGTAFASSLLGLAGSLVVGLLELFASQSQNRFYRELEEWLSSITRLGVAGATDFEGAGEGEGEAAQTAGLVQYMAQQMDGLAQIIVRGEQARADTDLRLAALADGVEKLTLALERETAGTGAALGRLADSQATIAERLAPQEPAREAGLFEGEGDPEARMHLRSIDTQLLRLLEEIAAGRQETLTELRTDLQQVSREVRKLTRSVTGVGDPGGGGRSKNSGS